MVLRRASFLDGRWASYRAGILLGLASALTTIAVSACSGEPSAAGGTTSSGSGGSGATSGSAGGAMVSSGAGGGDGAAVSSSSAGGGGAASASSGGGAGGAASSSASSSSSGGGAQIGVDCAAPAAGAVPPLKLTMVASGLARPTFVRGAPGDATRLYVLEQGGVIKLIKNGVVQATPFLDITSLVISQNERGLLGLAFHPDYESNGRFFVHYSDVVSGGAGVVAEYKRSADPDVADPTVVGVVLTQPQANGFHRGGGLEIGPNDGMLYVGFGDGGMVATNGQDLSTWLGKILRVDVSSLPYSIPPGNMTGAGVLPEIWDYGLRNPWRFGFDACTGDLYIGDVGNQAWEEVDVEPAGQGKKNYGWPKMEGNHCFQPPMNCDPNNALTVPAVEYDHVTGCSVSGGQIYRGGAIPALRGAYFYADLCTGKVWSFRWSGGVVSDHVERTADLGSAQKVITSIGQDAVGELYVVDYGMATGAVYRIDPE